MKALIIGAAEEEDPVSITIAHRKTDNGDFYSAGLSTDDLFEDFFEGPTMEAAEAAVVAFMAKHGFTPGRFEIKRINEDFRTPPRKTPSWMKTKMLTA